jgi:hypothetical protein
VEKPFVKANVLTQPGQKEGSELTGPQIKPDVCDEGEEQNQTGRCQNLSAKGGISSVKRGKKMSDMRSFCYERPSLF